MYKYNFSLVGFGRFGKVYFKEILNNNKIIITSIIKKKKYKKKYYKNTKIQIQKISDKIFFKKIHCAIIATPTSKHYINSKLFIEKKIPLIIEKPVSNKLTDIKNLDKICKKNQISVVVNYSDLYNEYLNYFLKNKKKIGRIHKIEINFQKRLNIYKKNKPIHDFLPHFLAIASKFTNIDGKLNLFKNDIFKKNSFIYQDCIFTITNKQKQIIQFNYSNKSFRKKRQVIVYGANGKFIYDGYKNQNNLIEINKKKIFIDNILRKKINSPIQNLLNKMCFILKNKKFYNDLPFSVKIQKLSDKLIKNLKI